MIIIMIIIKIQHTSAPLGGDGDRSRRLRAAMPVPAAHLHLQIFFFFCSFYSLDKNGSHDFFGVSIRIRNVHHDHKIHYQHLIFVWVYKNPNERLESCFWLGLSWISAHLSVKFSGLKICLFKKRTNIRHEQHHHQHDRQDDVHLIWSGRLQVPDQERPLVFHFWGSLSKHAFNWTCLSFLEIPSKRWFCCFNFSPQETHSLLFFFHLCRPWVLEPVGQPVLGTKSPEVNLI